MPFRSKGDDTKRYPITVPLSEKMRDRLRAYAKKLGRPPTAVARDLIEAGIPAPNDMKREKTG